MKNININIIQGKKDLMYADVNIIIDVLRAFTVSYYAFKNNIKEIILTSSENEAFKLSENNELYLTSGEVKGYKIDGFNFGNSPYEISKYNLKGRTLVQKTTNGVAVTLHALNAKNIFVTGYVNALSLANHVKKLIQESTKREYDVNIIASHPTGDEDLACAEYIKKLILEEPTELKNLDGEAIYRISNCDASQKFWDPKNVDFSINDMVMALNIENSNFIMEVIENENIKIRKRIIK